MFSKLKKNNSKKDDNTVQSDSFLTQSIELDKILSKALNNKIKMAIDDSTINSYTYRLSDYLISVPERTLTLKMTLETPNQKFRFTICRKYSELEITKSLCDENICSTYFEITLDGKIHSITAKWDSSKSSSEETPSERLILKNKPEIIYPSGLPGIAQRYQDSKGISSNQIISELYTKDKNGKEIYFLHKKGEIICLDTMNGGECGTLDYVKITRDTISIQENIQQIQNVGRGTAALHILIAYAKEKGFKHIEGDIVETDEKDIENKVIRDNLYLNCGFQIIGRKIIMDIE